MRIRGRSVLILLFSLATLHPVMAGESDAPQPQGGLPIPRDVSYACGRLLDDSSRLLLGLLDRWTGLPYDQIPCDLPPSPPGFVRAWGVVPQLAYAARGTFAEDPSQRDQTVLWSFADRGPGDVDPDLLYALRLELRLSPPGGGNAFGGLTWDAYVDASRYKTLRIRYATQPSDSRWDLKLNSGLDGRAESVVTLPGAAPGEWRDEQFDLPGAFPGVDLQHLKYLVLATHSSVSGPNPVIWVDQVSLIGDPAQAASCASFCPEPLPSFPDLSCYEPLTGAVNVANALSVLSLLADAGRLEDSVAEARVARMLATLESFPLHAATQSWFQDWHSPVSGMPDPRNRVASLTDQPQLFAALMVVERKWPALAARAAALRKRMDFSRLLDSPAACQIHWAFDRCAGVMPGYLEYVGRDSLLGSFLGVASGGAPACTWDSLAATGCALDGPPEGPWYTTGDPCRGSEIPATGTGGPFLQLAALTYLSSDRIPMGPLSLADSARHMLEAQARFAREQGLSLAGWSNASDPDACDYATCEEFTPSKVTPYIWAMGRSLGLAEASDYLLAFRHFGADAPLDTGTRTHAFGLRDAWNQSTMTGRNAYLYLDTGWSALGLLNSCRRDLARRWFAEHPIAQSGYAVLQGRPPLCSIAPSAATAPRRD